MRQAVCSVLFLLLAGCGGGSGPTSSQGVTVPAGPPNAVVSVTVNQDMSQGDYFLQEVTFSTAEGRVYHIEYCSDPVRLGDLVTLVPYEGDQLLCINGVQEAVIVDWDALGRRIQES